MDTPVSWTEVTAARRALIDVLSDALGDDDARWNEPSLAAGWRVRDVLGHLVFLAEGTRRTVLGAVGRSMVRRPGGPDAALARIARSVGERSPSELLARLDAAADGQFVLPGLGPIAAVNEVVIHGLDALVPLDIEPPPVTEDQARAMTESMVRLWPGYSRARRIRRFRISPDDATWATGPVDGPPLGGSTVSVLLTASGRLPLP